MNRPGFRTGDPDVYAEIAAGSPCCDGCGPGSGYRLWHPDGQARIRHGVAQLVGDQRQPPPCSPKPPPEAPPLHPTTVTTIGQAYYCVFTHYYAGPVLDDRVMLAAAFAGFTQELDRLGMDRPDATMPALTGDRGRDWTAFAAVYRKVTGQLPASPDRRQALAAVTMTGMIASLHDNHARWSYPAPPPGSVPGDLGTTTSPGYPLTDTAPQEALPPLFLTAVLPGFPAASHGLRPGDAPSSRSTARRRSPAASSPKG